MQIDPEILVGGGIALLLLLGGKKKEKKPEMTVEEAKTVIEKAPPAVVEKTRQEVRQQVATPVTKAVPAYYPVTQTVMTAKAATPTPTPTPTPVTTTTPSYHTPTPTPKDRPGMLTILFKPDPSRCGMSFLQKRYPNLGLKYHSMTEHPSKLQLLASTTTVYKAVDVLRADPCVVSVQGA